MSILDLRGPDFLQLFLALSFLLPAGCLAFRWLMAGPSDDHPSHEPDLDAMEVAYLAGGARAATDAAITSLVHRGALRVRGSAPPRLEVFDIALNGATPLESKVYAAVNLTGEATIRQVRRETAEAAERLSFRLADYEYVLDPMRRTVCRVVPIVVLIGLLLLGVMKVFVGLERGRPVAFLVVACVLLIPVIVLFAIMSPHRTRRGTRYLERLKAENAALQMTATAAPNRMSYADMALAYALYGPVVLAMGPLAELNSAMKPRKDGGSGCGGTSGSSCGSSSCGSGGGSSCGGGGGGGCGGCGGGGCGGS